MFPEELKVIQQSSDYLRIAGKLAFWATQGGEAPPALRYFEDELKTCFAGFVQVQRLVVSERFSYFQPRNVLA